MDDLREFNVEDYNVNVRIVTFIVISMVIILTMIYFIRIYTNKKYLVIKDMVAEASIIETVIEDHLNFSKYFLLLISNSIHDRYENLEEIKSELDRNLRSTEFNMMFGWRKYSWINKDFLEVVSSTKGIIKNPVKKYYIKNIVDNMHFAGKSWYDKIVFFTNRNESKEDSLKIIDFIIDDKNGKYMGSVVLSYDIKTMVKSLNTRKKNLGSNFIMLDEDFNLVFSSKKNIYKIIDEKGNFSKQINNIIKILRINHDEYDEKGASYLDMINGVNYHIKKLKNLPFVIIVNIDNNIIRTDILDSVTKKFIEVTFFAVLCLIMIISLYKRETSLRNRAEIATKLANQASKAKTNFLAFTAHEIRSPLGFILTGSEVMIKQILGPLSKKYIKYAEGIHKNSKIILEFITDILDENQIIEGKFKIVNNLVNIEDIIDDAIKQSKSRFNKNNINIKKDISNDLPLLVCDKFRILQVINNLINNSIKYSNEDPDILVEIKIVEGEMLIIISDKGIGMSQEDIEVALSTYGTVEHNNKHNMGSYGLGLPIVKLLLDAHEAGLDITSRKDYGTVVKIIFPKYKLVYNKEKNNEFDFRKDNKKD